MNKYQIDKNMFKKNNNIIFANFKMDWKIILFFIIFWSFITILCLGFTFRNPTLGITSVKYHADELKLPVIAKSQLSLNPDGGYPLVPDVKNLTSISGFLNILLFGSPEILLFGIISMFFINKIFINEINNGKVSFWTTLPLSRNQIFLSKYLFIIFTLFCIFMPSYLLIIIFSSIASDASKYIGDVILYGFETFLFNVFLLTLFLTLSLLLLSKSIVSNIIISIILLFIFLSSIFNYLYNNGMTGYIYKNIHYISIQSLIVNPLNFSQQELSKNPVDEWHIGDNIIYLIDYKYLAFNKILLPVFILIMFFSSVFLNYLNLKIFKKMNLNI